MPSDTFWFDFVGLDPHDRTRVDAFIGNAPVIWNADARAFFGIAWRSTTQRPVLMLRRHDPVAIMVSLWLRRHDKAASAISGPVMVYVEGDTMTRTDTGEAIRLSRSYPLMRNEHTNELQSVLERLRDINPGLYPEPNAYARCYANGRATPGLRVARALLRSWISIIDDTATARDRQIVTELIEYWQAIVAIFGCYNQFGHRIILPHPSD